MNNHACQELIIISGEHVGGIFSALMFCISFNID